MVAPGTPRRFDVYFVSLDPTVGSEIQKPRPCTVVSPDEMNRHIHTVIVAPMTTQRRSYPTRVTFRCKGKTGQVVLDQLRTVEVQRLAKKPGTLDPASQTEVLRALGEMFAP